MTERTPKKFVGLHSHSCLSIGDAIGLPQDHIDFAIENGADALALTDHGNMNGFSHQYLHAKKLKEKGVNFKAIPGCLLKGQPIITNKGIKPVEEIEVGDLVLTHKGRFRPVVSTMKRQYEGKLYSVFLSQTKTPLKLTEEHPILVRQRTGQKVWQTPNEILFGRPNKTVGVNAWNSWVCFPKTEETSTFIDVQFHLKDFLSWEDDYTCHRLLKPNRYYKSSMKWNIPQRWQFDETFARLLGFYVAEGWANEGGSFGFTFNINENEYIDFVVNELNRFNISTNVRQRTDKGSTDIEACNKPFANLLIRLFGKGAKNKFIPQEILTAPIQIKKAFIGGLVDGDGKAISNINSRRDLKVSSPHLAWTFKVLLSSIGYWAKVGNGIETRNQKEYSFWTVSYSPKRSWKKTLDDCEGTYKPIKKIECEHIKDVFVYNFEVEEDNSYCSDFVLHNCEAYFIPSLVDWHKMYQERKVEKEEARKAAEEEQDDLETSEEKNEEEEGGTVVENEEETKERKVKDPLKKRSHLVLLAKNQAGLKSLFRLVSNSYIDGFYLYPRMDFDGLKEHAKGNIIASSACVSGNAILETNVGLLSLKEVVERVKSGEEILTLSYDEDRNKVVFAKVLWGDCTRRNAKLLQIKLEDGTSVKVTADHKVFTNKGWLRADQLKENMPLRILTSNT
jgi:intein/homing endonuclease